MGNLNSYPVVSQTKSLVLLAKGDREEALEIQKDFLHECPIVAQGTSAVYYARGDTKSAVETQARCAEATLNYVDGIPVIGHLKGAYHYYSGDNDSGNKSMTAATRTTAVVGGGMAGCMAGPVGMVAGGFAAGTAVDGAVTAVETKKTGKYSPSGHIAAYENCVKNPSVSNVFDATAGVLMDGLTGYFAGSSVESGPAKMTRTHWRKWQYKNAKAGGTLPKPAASVTIKPHPAAVSLHTQQENDGQETQTTNKGYFSSWWSNSNPSKL